MNKVALGVIVAVLALLLAGKGAQAMGEQGEPLATALTTGVSDDGTVVSKDGTVTVYNFHTTATGASGLSLVTACLIWVVIAVIPLLAWLVCRDRVFPAKLRYRAFWTRVWAFCLDVVVMWPVMVCLLWIGLRSSSWAILESTHMLSLILYWTYLVVMHARYGQTLGKMVFKLKVVDVKTGGDISVWQALVRESLWCLLPELRLGSGIGWLAGAIWFWADVVASYFNARQQAIHDMVAGTVVVRTNIVEEGGISD